MTSGLSVGVIANPMSGRDVRRLITAASVFDNSEKARMVVRLLAGLGSAGVERALIMPAGGLSAGLMRELDGLPRGNGFRVPEVALVDLKLRGDARDTRDAVRIMTDSGVSAIVVLGGDGTNRIVAKHCGETPIVGSPGTELEFAL